MVVCYLNFETKGKAGQGPGRGIVEGNHSHSQAASKAAGDAKLAADGKADKIEGKVQNTIGGLKETLKEIGLAAACFVSCDQDLRPVQFDIDSFDEVEVNRHANAGSWRKRRPEGASANPSALKVGTDTWNERSNLFPRTELEYGRP